MKNKFSIVCLFFGIFAGIDGITLDVNATSKNLIMEIEKNQAVGMECSIYSNSIETFIIEYKQMFGSLNIACQLHLKSSAGKLKSTIDEMVDQKLDEYLANIDAMRSKVIEMKQYSYLHSVKKLNEKYESELQSLKSNLSNTIVEKNKLNESFGKCQSDLGASRINFTQIISEKNNNLTEFIENERILNNSVVKCQDEVKALQINFTETLTITQNINLEQIKLLTKTSITEQILSGSFEEARDLFLNSSEQSLITESVYNKTTDNAEKLIDFLNSLSDDEQIIRGYRLLFDQIIKNQQIYSTPTTTIAYRVFVDFKNKSDSNENLIYLREKLPQSLKNFLWNEMVLIQNVQLKTKSISPSYFIQDNLRMIPAMYSTDITDLNFAHYLYPISNGKYFHIKSKYENYYLYAETNEFALDNDRRGVFYWMKANETKEAGRWQLEPIEGTENFKIKNIDWNEYLAVAEGIVADPRYSFLRTFTLRSGKCEDDNCKWNFVKYTGKK